MACGGQARQVGPTRLPVAHLSELHKDEITSRSKAHTRMYTHARPRVCHRLFQRRKANLHYCTVEVSVLTLRRLMSYIYGAPILDVSRSHTTTQHSR